MAPNTVTSSFDRITQNIRRSVSLFFQVLHRQDPEGRGIEESTLFEAIREAVEIETQRDPTFEFCLGTNRSFKDFIQGEILAGTLYYWEEGGKLKYAISDSQRRIMTSLKRK